MTVKELGVMPIEKIIHLPEFVSLVNGENARYGQPILTPYWEIEFKAVPISDGKFQCFDTVTMFPTFKVYKQK